MFRFSVLHRVCKLLINKCKQIFVTIWFANLRENNESEEAYTVKLTLMDCNEKSPEK